MQNKIGGPHGLNNRLQRKYGDNCQHPYFLQESFNPEFKT
jgi:hypothetical protein